MAALGGKIIYSTCSMNPIEDEAVVAAALRHYGTTVTTLDVSDQLPELKRIKGATNWNVLNDAGNPIDKEKSTLPSSMWPPTEEEQDIKNQLAR